MDDFNPYQSPPLPADNNDHRVVESRAGAFIIVMLPVAFSGITAVIVGSIGGYCAAALAAFVVFNGSIWLVIRSFEKTSPSPDNQELNS